MGLAHKTHNLIQGKYFDDRVFGLVSSEIMRYTVPLRDKIGRREAPHCSPSPGFEQIQSSLFLKSP